MKKIYDYEDLSVKEIKNCVEYGVSDWLMIPVSLIEVLTIGYDTYFEDEIDDEDNFTFINYHAHIVRVITGVNKNGFHEYECYKAVTAFTESTGELNFYSMENKDGENQPEPVTLEEYFNKKNNKKNKK